MDKNVLVLASNHDPIAKELSKKLLLKGYFVKVLSDEKKNDFAGYARVYALPSFGKDYVKFALNALRVSEAEVVIAVSVYDKGGLGVDIRKLNKLSGESVRLKVVYYGEIVGQKKGIVAKLVRDVKHKKTVIPLRNFSLYFTFFDRLAETLLEPFDGNYYFGFKESFWDLANYFKKSGSGIRLVYSSDYFVAPEISFGREKIETFGQEEFLKITSFKKNDTSKDVFFIRNRNRLTFLLLACVWFLIFPFLTLFASTSLAFSSFGDLARGKKYKSNNWKIKYSRKFADLSKAGFSLFHMPYFYNVSDVTYSLSLLAEQTVSLEEMMSKVTSNNLENVSEVYLKSDSVYRDALFVEGKIDSLGLVGKLFGGEGKDYLAYKNYIFDTRSVFSLLSSVLGREGETKYAVLALDESRLTPVGGRINSVEVVSLNHGRIVGREEIDSDYIDENLNGVITPIGALDKYLGESRMRFSDIGWYQNFGEFSGNVAWFMERSLGERVDGVVAVNKSAYKKLFDKKDNPNLFVDAYDLWKKGDVQLNTTGVLSEKSFNENCGENCDTGHFGFWEMNLGGEDSAKISRKASLEVFVSEGLVKHKLTLSYGTLDDYSKTYLKLWIGENSKLVSLSINDANQKDSLDSLGDGEYGVYLYIPVGESEKIVLEWERRSGLSTSEPGKYIVDWKRQSGTPAFEAKISFRSARDFLTNNNLGLYNTLLSGELVKEFDF